MRIPSPPLLVISDRRQASRPLEEIAEAVFAGGCRWFSLREKDLPIVERCALLERLVAIGHRYGATVMVHEDIEAAAVTGADGVHLPAGGNPTVARGRLPGALVGASAHSLREASELLRAGADYVTVSPVFVTASKPGYGPALGRDGLANIVAHTDGVVIALGGITAENAALCCSTGARGVAVMGEVMRSADPQATIKHILSAFQSSQAGRQQKPGGTRC